MKELKIEAIKDALERCYFNTTQAAKLLKVSVRTVRNYKRQYFSEVVDLNIDEECIYREHLEYLKQKVGWKYLTPSERTKEMKKLRYQIKKRLIKTRLDD